MVTIIRDLRESFLNNCLIFEVKDSNNDYAIKLQKSNSNPSTPHRIGGEKKDCNEIYMTV